MYIALWLDACTYMYMYIDAYAIATYTQRVYNLFISTPIYTHIMP